MESEWKQQFFEVLNANSMYPLYYNERLPQELN